MTECKIAREIEEIKKEIVKSRSKTLRLIFEFIDKASWEELRDIIAEIRCVHDNLFVFNQEDGCVRPVDSVFITDQGIQLCVE